MPITGLEFNNVGPFDEIEFEFDDHVNVFVGPNNSGKSTALIVLGGILVFPFEFPKKLLRKASNEYKVLRNDGKKIDKFGGILPTAQSIESWKNVPWMQQVEWLETIGYSCFIPALRRSTDYRSRGPIKGNEGSGHLPTLYSELNKRLGLTTTNASIISDEAIIQKIIELDYRSYRRNEPAIRELVDKIAAMASEITEGFPIEFLRVEEDEERLLFPQFRTPDGDVPLNVLSQGTQSIIQWLAHLLIGYAEYYDYPPDLEDKPGIVIIDEIDAHLHPSWQRRIIPTLAKHFPNLQIFCSTHSPLMLAGLNAGQVQLLKRDEKGKVIVSRNETDIVGWTADEILRTFLDVSSPTDLPTVGHIERLQELRRVQKLTPEQSEELEQLRRHVNQDLLGGPIAGQMEQLTSLMEQAKTKRSVKKKPAKKRRKPSPTSTSPQSSE